MPLSVQGYYGVIYVNSANMTMLSLTCIQVLKKPGGVQIVVENTAQDAY